MKYYILTPILILTIFISCNNSEKKEDKQQVQEIPKALQEKNSFETISKRDYGDLIENLYSELVEKTPELKDLEITIENTFSSSSDSMEVYNMFNQKNKSYYKSANYHLKQISDSVLKNKIKDIITVSLTKYNSKVSQHTELIKSIDKKTSTLNDLHEILKITTSLSIIEKYQDENLPKLKSLEAYSTQLNKVIHTENQLIDKKTKE